MPKKSKSSKTESKSKGSKKGKKGSGQEASYITKQIDSSITILDSPEDTLIMEALLFLTEYADLHRNNLRYIQQNGVLPKVLSLFNRNICILRLVLKMLGMLLTLQEVVEELDQEEYDERILEICNKYISSPDQHVRQYCVSILSKLTESCRITCNIFSINLFKPIIDTIKKSTDMVLLEWTLELFLRLLKAPAASQIQKEMCDFDLVLTMKYLDGDIKRIVELSLLVIENLTNYCFEVCQQKFKKAKLVEKMFNLIMNEQKKDYHTLAFSIIANCIKCKETSDYFIESLEFLQFCQWVKTCDEQYLLPSIDILEQLTRIPSRRQILFDLSVEETIQSFLRSEEKKVLNKVCESIINMMAHKYCCEQMLTPTLMKELFTILVRKGDEEDPENEVALKTIIDFSRKKINTLDIIHEIGAHTVLLSFFKRGDCFSSDDSFSGILEILYTMSLNPLHQVDIISPAFFEGLLDLFVNGHSGTASFACQIMTNFIGSTEFRSNFVLADGPQIFTTALQVSKDVKLLKNTLSFIYNNLTYPDMICSFLRCDLVRVLKEFPETIKPQAPIVDKILRLIYDTHPSLKLYDTNRLEVTDKLNDKFYLITGLWKEPFPFLNDLVEAPISPLFSVYVVDYVVDTKFIEDNSAVSDTMTPTKLSSERTLSTLSEVSSGTSSFFRRSLFEINYGKLSADPFLTSYIFHVTQYLMQVESTEEKIRVLANYINAVMSMPEEGYANLDKIHNLKLHVEYLKHKLGTNAIPIGYLRQGGHCERAVLFKAMADKTCVPATLIKGKNGIYWNEVGLLSDNPKKNLVKLYVVDLVEKIGSLLRMGSRAANRYCNWTN